MSGRRFNLLYLSLPEVGSTVMGVTLVLFSLFLQHHQHCLIPKRWSFEYSNALKKEERKHKWWWGEEKGQGRNQSEDAVEGTSIASTAQHWNEMKGFSPKGALIPSTNSSPPSARRLPEAGAGPQFVRCNVIRGRWHLCNELIFNGFVPHLPDLCTLCQCCKQATEKKRSLYFVAVKACSPWDWIARTVIVWVIAELYSFSLPLWIEYTSLLRDVGLSFMRPIECDL